MNISSNLNVVTTEGNIKTIADFNDIKNNVGAVALKHNSIVVDVKNSLSLTSAVIGYFTKLALKDKIRMQVNVGDGRLYELLDDLCLVSVFNLKKI